MSRFEKITFVWFCLVGHDLIHSREEFLILGQELKSWWVVFVCTGQMFDHWAHLEPIALWNLAHALIKAQNVYRFEISENETEELRFGKGRNIDSG